MRLVTTIAILTVILSSCAKRPDAIAPVDIPMAAYSNMSCQGLGSELAREQSTLAALSSQQSSAATGDALGVFLVGVPVSSTFGGDKEGLIAVSKGKINALEASLRSKGCTAR